MSDGSRWNPDDIEVGEEGSSKKNLESLKEQLKVVDNLKEKGEALLEKIYGDASHGHTIFKCERKSDDRGPPEPKAVAVGPYHRNCKNRLTFSDDYKLAITRFMVQYCGLDAEKYLEEMEKNEEAVCSCYDKDLSEWSSEFPKMLLLDSSFILFVMDGFYKRNLVPDDFFTEYMALHLEIREHSEQIKLDMLTVDNQIPFFTIKRLLGCFPRGSSIRKESIEELALWCFDDLWPMKNEEQVLGKKQNEEQDLLKKRNEENDLEKKRKEEQVVSRSVAQFHHLLRLFDLWSRRNKLRVTSIGVPRFLKGQEMSSDVPDQFHHLLHLFHWSRIPKKGYEIDFQTRGLGRWHYKNASKQYIPSATELRKSATKFKKKDSGSCLDVTFNRELTYVSGVINIPVLQLYDYSKPIFRNLIAFEATPTNRVLCFTAYTQCMSRMLHQEDDVKLLRERRIIASTSYNNADVITFFKDMNGEIEDIEMPYTLLVLYDDVTNHCNRRISKWWGNFMLQYCPNFWVALSLLAAIVLFALSFLQALYGMLSYYLPKKK